MLFFLHFCHKHNFAGTVTTVVTAEAGSIDSFTWAIRIHTDKIANEADGFAPAEAENLIANLSSCRDEMIIRHLKVGIFIAEGAIIILANILDFEVLER